jgi:hypothetical protein
MKKIFCILIAVSIIFVVASCSLIGIGGSPTPTSGTVTFSYPSSVVYQIMLSNETYLCSSFSVNNTDAAISLQLKEVYSVASDGKVTWVGADKEITAVKIEKVSK